MQSNYTKIDVENWKRNMLYHFFRNAENGQYSVSYEVDITKFLSRVKENNLSFYYSMIYAVTKCANQVEEFRYRILNGEVLLYDTISPSFTGLDKETELFKVVTVDMINDMEEFVKKARNQEENQKKFFVGPVREDVFHMTCLPWISFTHVSHTVSANKEAAIPTFAWGKYYEKEQKVILPFSVQVHHSFVDGVHIGKFAKILDDFMNGF
ncbi:chloramphenicol acetyltransferase [Anaeromicropila populeti]|uniref:Chloramphenicol O-acetyltransferase type B n=1 Tax=Anaeromicropila populeti TaxID=37658 RepID=A0A1I6KRH0_9FIRM|nr:chloramphenicol acetyltransferase [Anaeromicropila populeti]SFR93510.1 chloramphenicol O-acetyltransferase type B [Anaeromicropila populeti]